MSKVYFPESKIMNDGDNWLCLKFDKQQLYKCRDIVDTVNSNDKTFVADIKQHHEKRSLNANAYAWVLITEIANVLRANKDDIYLAMLKKYGQSDIVSVKSEIDVKPYFKYYEVAGTTVLKGTDFTHYKVFKGSSEFDTREMSILIDGIISDAKELNIVTATPEELARMKEDWK